MVFFAGLNDFDKANPGITPRWTAHVAYTQIAMWADAVTRTKSFYPPGVIGTLEAGAPLTLMLGPVHYRAGDHQLVRPVPVVIGKQPSAMKNKDDFFDVVDIIKGDDVMAPLSATMCKMPPVT
jgi:branched-chain amino acid transport system substrate-binding protein